MFRQAGAQPAQQPPPDAQTFKQKQTTTKLLTHPRITTLTPKPQPTWEPQRLPAHGTTSTGDTRHPHWHGATTKKTPPPHTRLPPPRQETAQAATL